MCVGKSILCKLIVSLLGNSSMDQVSGTDDVMMETLGESESQSGQVYFESSFPSFKLFHIHSFDLHMFTEQLLCVRCCHKS